MRSRNRRPQVEALETLTPLTGLSGAIGGAIEAGHPALIHELPQTVSARPLRGTTQGSYSINRGIPDTGTTYVLHTTGRITPLGRSTVTAEVHTPGFIAQGRASGSMSIVSPHGVVALTLTGPIQPGFAPLPSTMTYQIVGGTGVSRKLVRSGSISLAIGPSSAASDAGALTLTFVRG